MRTAVAVVFTWLVVFCRSGLFLLVAVGDFVCLARWSGERGSFKDL